MKELQFFIGAWTVIGGIMGMVVLACFVIGSVDGDSEFHRKANKATIMVLVAGGPLCWLSAVVSFFLKRIWSLL